MDPKKLIEESNSFIMNTYSRFPVVLRKGRGVKVWSVEGKEYLDFIGGVAVNVLGHCHPKVVLAVQKQAQRLIHASNLFYMEPQIKLARLLVENSFADRVFFCNSGAEAVEASIKLARKYAKEHIGPGRFEIISALNSFHGRTMGSLSATGQEKFHKGFEPLLPGFVHVPYNDMPAVEKAVSSSTCAVLLEPVQGEAGVKVPSPDYLKKVRELCDSKGILLIFDEVQTCMGRTGKLFAYEHFGVTPDIMAMAKGLGGGMAIGAMLAKDAVARTFVPGDHASTFGGNPVACAAAVAAIETVLDAGLLLDQCNRMSDYLFDRLNRIKEKYSGLVVEVRGMGLLIGMEMTRDCSPISRACFDKGVLINCTSGNVLRFMPPLTVHKNDMDLMAEVLEEVLEGIS